MISILCPSRGRPAGFLEMCRSAFDLADDPLAVEVVAYIDEDDPCLDTYTLPDYPEHGARVRMNVGPRILMSETWNRCSEQADGEILMQGSDDVRFRTPGWDRIIGDAFKHFPDRIALVHGDDGGDHPQELATLGFVHRRWIDATGYFLAPYFHSDMNDRWITEVADTLGRRVRVDVLTEHLHPLWGKGPLDQTHLERMERHAEQRPDLLYDELAPERAADVEKLRAAMQVTA